MLYGASSKPFPKCHTSFSVLPDAMPVHAPMLQFNSFCASTFYPLTAARMTLPQQEPLLSRARDHAPVRYEPCVVMKFNSAWGLLPRKIKTDLSKLYLRPA
jgi:hypothetical protein